MFACGVVFVTLARIDVQHACGLHKAGTPGLGTKRQLGLPADSSKAPWIEMACERFVKICEHCGPVKVLHVHCNVSMRCEDFAGTSWIKVDSVNCKRNKPLRIIYNLLLEKVQTAIYQKQLGDLTSTVLQKIADLQASDIQAGLKLDVVFLPLDCFDV